MAGFDDRFKMAVHAFWTGRTEQQQKQRMKGRQDAGGRGAVTGGGHLGPLEDLFKDLLIGCGIPESAIHKNRKLELPGYYRSEKQWDLIVAANNKLHIAIEFKSQVGPSFGNNFNNRTEEAIGNAVDLRRAIQERALGDTVSPPFLGYFFLLEDCPKVHSCLCLEEPHFKVDDAFLSTSHSMQRKLNRMLRAGVGYAKRYEVLIERLLLENLYSAGCLTLASRAPLNTISFPNSNLSARQFVGRLEGFAKGVMEVGL